MPATGWATPLQHDVAADNFTPDARRKIIQLRKNQHGAQQCLTRRGAAMKRTLSVVEGSRRVKHVGRPVGFAEGKRAGAREGIQFNLRVNLVWPVKARVLSSLEFSISFDEFKSANLLTAIFLPDFDLWRFNHPKTFIRDNLQRAYLFASIENVTVH
ncbi:MAG TPA: hypothetical protein PLF85_01580 [Turneriella sp.]|nr:hypothetical protein [Turneriella sp.]